MGTEAVWVPLVAAAVAGGATYANNRSVAKRTDRELAAQLMRSGQKQREADARVTQEITKQAGSTGEGERAGILSQYLGQINQGRQSTMGGLVNLPAANDAYRQAAADAALGLEDRGNERAKLFSVLDGALVQRQNEDKSRGRLEDDLNGVQRDIAADDYVTGIRMRQIRRNPYLDALASAANSYGSAYSGGATSAASGASSAGAGWGGGVTNWGAIARAGATG